MPPKKHPVPDTSLWRFMIPSLMGVLLFMVPISHGGKHAIIISHLAGGLCTLAGIVIPCLILIVLLLLALLAILRALWQPRWIMRYGWLTDLAVVTPLWTVMRLLAAVFGLLTFLSSFTTIGDYWICSKATGHKILFEVLPILTTNLLVSSLLSPLLLEFGLLEFVGTMVTPVMRPLFQLPGHAAVHCMTSWIGDGTVGTVMAMQAYERGHYTEKEASMVITSFAAVSLTFYATILHQLNLEAYFGAFCVTTILSSFIAALILPRIPPLCYKRARYYHDAQHTVPPTSTAREGTLWQEGLAVAYDRAAGAPFLPALLKKAFLAIVDVMSGVLPGVMVIGTISLALAEYTPVFTYLGALFVPILDAMRVPEASKASEALLIGFTDMFTPTLLARAIDAPVTRFMIAALSVTQIVYLSELGPLLLRQRKLPLYTSDLALIFLLRTMITFPIIRVCAWWFFG